MKQMYVAVFGHYDSRGGTTAMPLTEVTEDTVRRAIKEYNKLFMWEDTLREYREDRQRPEDERLWEWNPLEEGSSPGEQDFLYVAILYYPQGEDLEGDLEDRGVVILATYSEPDFGELPKTDMDGAPYHGDWTTKHKIAESMKRLTELEFIPLGKSRYADQGDEDDTPWRERTLAKARVLTGGDREIPSWNDDAFGFIIGTGLE